MADCHPTPIHNDPPLSKSSNSKFCFHNLQPTLCLESPRNKRRRGEEQASPEPRMSRQDKRRESEGSRWDQHTHRKMPTSAKASSFLERQTELTASREDQAELGGACKDKEELRQASQKRRYVVGQSAGSCRSSTTVPWRSRFPARTRSLRLDSSTERADKIREAAEYQ